MADALSSPPARWRSALARAAAWHPAVLLTAAALVVYLNFDANDPLFKYYRDHARIVRAGFDPGAAVEGVPTFPMWGYGFVLLLTEDRLALVLLQCALAVPATLAFLSRASGLVSGPVRHLLQLGVALSLPWLGYHAVPWPNSFAVSGFLLALVWSHDALVLERHVTRHLVGSALAFGLVLNFRSDLTFMPFAMAAVYLAVTRFRARPAGRIAAWLLGVHLLLVPYALFSHRVTGEYLVKSTNGGHVLFLGLGNLPGNAWGITPSDTDPHMHAVVEEALGPGHSSLSQPASDVLTARFVQYVKDDPVEYARKCLHSLRHVATDGAYTGQFDTRTLDALARAAPDRGARYALALEWARRDPLVFLAPPLLANIVSVLQGRLLVLLSYLLLPVTLVRVATRREPLLVLIVLAIAYQTALDVLAFHMPAYATNVWLFHATNVAVGVAGLLTLASRLRRAAQPPAGELPEREEVPPQVVR